ncbi:MAG: AraC family transcriptional regulator [Oliverpabstia sp.]
MKWMAYSIREQIRITDMYSLFEEHFDTGYTFSGEVHNFWECMYVLNGELCVSGDERVYNLTQNHMIFHKPMELHKFNVTGSRGASLLIFSFSAEGPLTVYLRNKVFALSLFQKEIITGMLSYIHANTEKTVTEEDRFYHYLDPFQRYPIYAQMLSTYLQQLMLSLAEEGIISSVSSAPDAICFSKAINYLNSNIHRQPVIPEIAGFCHVSEATIKRVFDKYAGIGVHKYLLKMKIKVALELLQEGECINSVAEKVGFSSQSYFSKAFKRETGRNPSDFKQK